MKHADHLWRKVHLMHTNFLLHPPRLIDLGHAYPYDSGPPQPTSDSRPVGGIWGWGRCVRTPRSNKPVTKRNQHQPYAVHLHCLCPLLSLASDTIWSYPSVDCLSIETYAAWPIESKVLLASDAKGMQNMTPFTR